MAEYRFFDPKYDEFLEHSGVPGMKWGIRNYQYTDGTWTELGKERRRIGNTKYAGDKTEAHKNKPPLIRTERERTFILSLYEDFISVNAPADPLDLKETEDRKTNCGYCSVAYELRRRGYDIKAKPAAVGLPNKELAKIFGKTNFDHFKTTGEQGFCASLRRVLKNAKSFKEAWEGGREAKFSKGELLRMQNELRLQGDGARGIIGEARIRNGMIAGHVRNYEVFDGSVYLIDSQNRRIGRGFDGAFNNDCILNYLRTDNLQIDEQVTEQLFGEKLKRKG